MDMAMTGLIVLAVVLLATIAVLVGRYKSANASTQEKCAALEEEVMHLNTQLSAMSAEADIVAGRLEEEKAELTTRVNEASLSLATMSERNTGLSAQVDKQDGMVAELKEEVATLHASLEQARIAFAKQQTKTQEDQLNFDKQRAQFEETKAIMKQEFENLANRIVEEKGQSLSTSNQQNLDSILKPFKDQLEGFQKRVNEVHDAAIRDNGALGAEIKKVLDVGLKMSEEASNLSSALKGDSQQRGAWGEAQLERTLEMSGLIEKEHYDKQSSFKDADGKQKQTDYLIRLPDEKHIVIDSKVTMVAYDKLVSAETEEQSTLAMAEHIKAVRRHIDDLASKDYTNLVGVHSPSFVLMFMPIEPAYIDVLKANRDIFDYGYNKGVILVSHTTLIPILRTVSNLWMIDRSNKEARKVSESAGDIFNSVCTVAERVQRVGTSLSAASNHYNDIVKSLTGRQGLYGKVDRFSTLSAKVTKSLPKVNESHIDFDTERLDVAVEALEESAPPKLEESVASTPAVSADVEGSDEVMTGSADTEESGTLIYGP